MNDSAYFALNYECNNRCLFCPNRNEKYIKEKAIDFETFKASLDTMLSKSKIKHITISGGEPTLNKDFIKIAKYATECNITVGLFSNSNTFANENFVHEFISNVKPDKIIITTALHSHVPEIHDETTQVQGSFYRSVHGLKNLINQNYRVMIKSCINRLNYKHINKFIDFVTNEFPSVKNMGLYGLDYCGTSEEQNKKVKVSFLELTPYLEKALEAVENKSLNCKVQVFDLPLCIVNSKYWKYFSSNKNKTNAARTSPETKKSEHGQVEFNISNQCGTFSLKCKDCAVALECPGTWKASWKLLGDEEIHPVKY